MSVTSTSSTTSSSSTSSDSDSSTSSSSSLGKDDFLRLLTAQLANQDPLDPMDNSAFVAQLAQFSSLEQLENVSSQLDTLLVAAASQNQLGATSLVGKDVTYNASSLTVGSDGTVPTVNVDLNSAASVTAVISDSNGNTIRTLAFGNCAAGTFSLGWDGRDSSGNQVSAGSYTLALSATAADGSSATVNAQVTGLVTGVAFDGSVAQLVVGGANVAMSNVVQISQP